MRKFMHFVSAVCWVSGLITDAQEDKPKLVMIGIAGHVLSELVANALDQRRLA